MVHITLRSAPNLPLFPKLAGRMWRRRVQSRGAVLRLRKRPASALLTIESVTRSENGARLVMERTAMAFGEARRKCSASPKILEMTDGAMRLAGSRECVPCKCRKIALAGVLLALIFGSSVEVRSADRPPSLAGVGRYSAPATEGSDMIGHKASRWEVRDWINSKPLTLEELRGKVVLVRWWTAPGCPFCEASAPALNEFFPTLWRPRAGGHWLLSPQVADASERRPCERASPQARSHVSSGDRSRLDHVAKLVARQTRPWLDIGDHSSRPPRGDQACPPGWRVLQRRSGYDSLQAEIETLLAEPST